MPATLALALVLFAFTFWLGGYLIARNPAKLAMHLAGWGLIAYAAAWAVQVIDALTNWNVPSLLQTTLTLLPAVLWTASLVLLLRAQTDGVEAAGALRRRPIGLVILGALFFALSLGLLMANVLPTFWMLALIGVDIGILGVAVAKLDAFDEGESFAPDLLRSLLAASLSALVFGGAVALAAAAMGWTLPVLVLIFAVLALAIDAQLFAPRLNDLLDRITFSPNVQQSRAELRAVEAALPRADHAIDLTALDAAEFARLTRRALSQMNDLPKLAANPLTALPGVDRYLAQHNLPDHPLNRANALKAVLAQHIARLKPDQSAFGTSDAWRHYNALHFPYVVGLRPYSLRASQNGHALDEHERAALAWFQATVPERTLHNWQNAAAKVIASELRR